MVVLATPFSQVSGAPVAVPGSRGQSVTGGSGLRDGHLDLEPGVLKVEVALDSVHHVVADRTLVAELDDGVALGVEQLAHQPLLGPRPVLVAVVGDLAGLRLEAPATEVVGAPE